MFKYIFLFATMSAVCAFAAVSDKCREEIIDLPNTKKDFDLQKFPKDLGISVAKVKASCKIKITCPKDSKMTDVGLTAGCVKQLPSEPDKIQALLKDIGMDVGENIVK